SNLVPPLPVPPQAPVAPAYSPGGVNYRRAFNAACLRVARAVFALGMLLLFALGG
ncbi:MAG: hypothetical protein H0V19_07845, partial [Euzebyales bacterium]|nr:hypothetical protein [Euzebyales bacterium]